MSTDDCFGSNQIQNQIPMKCEHPNCHSTDGQDYYRNAEDQVEGWEDEPIFLCWTHANGHTPIKSKE